jgi:hypothetical protein
MTGPRVASWPPNKQYRCQAYTACCMSVISPVRLHLPASAKSIVFCRKLQLQLSYRATADQLINVATSATFACRITPLCTILRANMRPRASQHFSLQ